MKKTLLAIFVDREDAEEAIGALESKGYNPKDMSIVMKDATERKELAENTGADTANGAVGGAAAGATLGGLAGLVSAYAIPGLGAFFIGGPIALALGLTGAAAAVVSGAATGALAGGLLGALTNLGLSDDEAHVYTDRVKAGAILLAVPIAGDTDEAYTKAIVRTANAENIKVISHDRSTERRVHASA